MSPRERLLHALLVALPVLLVAAAAAPPPARPRGHRQASARPPSGARWPADGTDGESLLAAADAASYAAKRVGRGRVTAAS